MPGLEPSESAHSTAKCRTCTDFKTWTKQQRKNTKQGSQVSKKKSMIDVFWVSDRIGRF